MIYLSNAHERGCKAVFNRVLFPVVLVLFCTCAGVGYANTKLDVEAVTMQSLPEKLLLEGTVEAVNEATLTAQVSGTIVELNFDVNDFVTKDQVLMRFKGNKNQSALLQAEANRMEAEANLRQANSEHRRIQQLFAKKMVTASAMDKAVAGLAAAKARLSALQAQVDSAQDTVGDTVIHAPFSGYVLKRFVRLGEVAQVGQPLFSGMSLESLRVHVMVPQSQIEGIRPHKTAWIVPDDPSKEAIQSSGFVIFPYAEPGSRTFGVRLSLPEKSGGFYPGMLVKVAFKMGEKKRLLIPSQAIVKRSEVTGVYVVKRGYQISLRRIRVGHTLLPGRVEVLAGLQEGEKIALDPIRAGQLSR